MMANHSTSEPSSFVRSLEQTPEFKIIATLLEQPDVEIETTVEKLIERTRLDAKVPVEESMHFYHTACAIQEVARRTAPENQDKLCDFVIELRNSSLQHPGTGEPERSQVIGWTFGDEFQSSSPSDSKKTAEEAQKDENFETFVAKWTGDTRDSQIDWSWHGQSSIISAFHLPTADILPGCLVHTVRLACWWYVYAAELMWAKVLDPENDDWPRDKWNEYKDGLVTTHASMRNWETKKLMERAMEAIERAESGDGKYPGGRPEGTVGGPMCVLQPVKN